MTLQKITGSTGGKTPLTDGGVRGAVAAAVTSGVTGFCVRVLGVSEGDYLAYIAPATVLMSFAAYGAWDRFVAPRLAKPEE